MTFRKSGWASEAVRALQQYDVVQVWPDCDDLGPHDDHLQVHRSFCRLAHEGAPMLASGYVGDVFAHVGDAWAATRRALSLLGGLIETAALGAGDHHMALGRVRERMPDGVNDGDTCPLLRWQARAAAHRQQ
ncbi:MAG TPA: hypothetical protein VK726_12555 [Acetobacteraceae bacterium]|nr:hypothetical protein [Acetobacteraceae bacterium]